MHTVRLSMCSTVAPMAGAGGGDITGNVLSQGFTSPSPCTHVQGAHGAPTGAVGGAANGRRARPVRVHAEGEMDCERCSEARGAHSTHPCVRPRPWSRRQRVRRPRHVPSQLRFTRSKRFVTLMYAYHVDLAIRKTQRHSISCLGRRLTVPYVHIVCDTVARLRE